VLLLVVVLLALLVLVVLVVLLLVVVWGWSLFLLLLLCLLFWFSFPLSLCFFATIPTALPTWLLLLLLLLSCASCCCLLLFPLLLALPCTVATSLAAVSMACREDGAGRWGWRLLLLVPLEDLQGVRATGEAGLGVVRV
jgi:hypothetical protein